MENNDPNRPHKTILLVEDNEGDVELLKDIFEESTYPHRLVVVEDGEDAIAFVNEHEHPDLILLDINMPRMNGHETLCELKNNPKTSDIPVIILTSSNASPDIKKAREKGGNGYLIKPADCEVEDLVSALDLIQQSAEIFLHVGEDQ